MISQSTAPVPNEMMFLSLRCRLRDCPGDEARISHLASNMTVKLVGRMQIGQQVCNMLHAILHHRGHIPAVNPPDSNHAHTSIKPEHAEGAPVPALHSTPSCKHLALHSNACPSPGGSDVHSRVNVATSDLGQYVVMPNQTLKPAFHNAAQLANGIHVSNRTQNGYY